MLSHSGVSHAVLHKIPLNLECITDSNRAYKSVIWSVMPFLSLYSWLFSVDCQLAQLKHYSSYISLINFIGVMLQCRSMFAFATSMSTSKLLSNRLFRSDAEYIRTCERNIHHSSVFIYTKITFLRSLKLKNGTKIVELLLFLRCFFLILSHYSFSIKENWDTVAIAWQGN